MALGQRTAARKCTKNPTTSPSSSGPHCAPMEFPIESCACSRVPAELWLSAFAACNKSPADYDAA